jgi:zinc protease
MINNLKTIAMKKIFLIKVITSILFMSSLALFTNAQEVVELKMPRSNKVVIKLMFRNGSVSDPVGKQGLTYLTTELIADGGSQSMTKAQIQDKIYPWAASISASADKEVSIFTFQTPAEYLDSFYVIVRDLVTKPGFRKEDFDRIKSNQKNYVDEVIRQSSDEEYSKKALEDFLFQGTTYQHMVAGTSQGVASNTLEDVKTHYSKNYSMNNLTIGIAGNYPPAFLEKLKNDMKKTGGGAAGNPAPAGTAITPSVSKDGMMVRIVSKENALGSAVFMGFPMNVTRKSDDFAALMVANSWLGEHRKSYSHLYEKIREQRSMNYGDYSYIEWYQGGGGNMLPPPGVPRSTNYFAIWLRPVQTAMGLKKQYPELSNITIGHAHFALRMALHEMHQMVNNGMNKADFETTRDFLRSYIKLYVQTPERQLGYLMDSRFYGRKNYITEMDALLANLTLDQVNNAMKKYWAPGMNNFYITIVTDKSEAEPLAKSLRENLPSPMSYSNSLKSSLSEKILAEDKTIENYKLNIKDVQIMDSNDTFGGIKADEKK